MQNHGWVQNYGNAEYLKNQYKVRTAAISAASCHALAPELIGLINSYLSAIAFHLPPLCCARFEEEARCKGSSVRRSPKGYLELLTFYSINHGPWLTITPLEGNDPQTALRVSNSNPHEYELIPVGEDSNFFLVDPTASSIMYLARCVNEQRVTRMGSSFFPEGTWPYFSFYDSQTGMLIFTPSCGNELVAYDSNQWHTGPKLTGLITPLAMTRLDTDTLLLVTKEQFIKIKHFGKQNVSVSSTQLISAQISDLGILMAASILDGDRLLTVNRGTRCQIHTLPSLERLQGSFSVKEEGSYILAASAHENTLAMIARDELRWSNDGRIVSPPMWGTDGTMLAINTSKVLFWDITSQRKISSFTPTDFRADECVLAGHALVLHGEAQTGPARARIYHFEDTATAAQGTKDSVALASASTQASIVN